MHCNHSRTWDFAVCALRTQYDLAFLGALGMQRVFSNNRQLLGNFKTRFFYCKVVSSENALTRWQTEIYPAQY